MLNDENQNKALLAVYSEVCKSYHAIDDFRTKLLGFLPLTSIAGIFLLDPSKMLSPQSPISHELFGFAAIFAAALTLALFSYEVRGMQRTSHLVNEGKHLEEMLGIGHGLFHVCVEEHNNALVVPKVFNAKILASVIYSVVFAAWLFIALRLGFGINVRTCSLCALVIGLLLAVGVSLFVQRLIPA
ncbi:MAG: hypothetical protein ABR577_18140 [Pyrinomonadaceae bacterium]